MFQLMPWKRERNEGTGATSHPLQLFRRLDDALDRLWDGAPFYSVVNNQNWGATLKETEQDIVVSLDAPGFESQEFDVQASGDYLAIKAEHKIKDGDNEVVTRALSREFSLPTPIDPQKVRAQYRNGVLEINLTKAEQCRWHKIAVKAE